MRDFYFHREDTDDASAPSNSLKFLHHILNYRVQSGSEAA